MFKARIRAFTVATTLTLLIGKRILVNITTIHLGIRGYRVTLMGHISIIILGIVFTIILIIIPQIIILQDGKTIEVNIIIITLGTLNYLVPIEAPIFTTAIGTQHTVM